MTALDVLVLIGGGATALAAAVALLALTPKLARWAGLSGAGVALIAFSVAAGVVLGAQVPPVTSLMLRPLSVVLLTATAVTLFAVLLGAQRRNLDGAGVAVLLLTATAIIVTYTASDLEVLAVAWCVVPLPGWWALRRHGDRVVSRLYARFVIGGSVPTAAALFALGSLTRSGAFASLPPAAMLALFCALLVGILTRMGIVPLHVWLPVLVERGPVGVAVLLSTCSTGAFLLARVGAPLFPQYVHSSTGLLAALGLGTAVYGALIAWAHPRLMGAVAGLVLSVGGLVMAGLCTEAPAAIGGATCLWVAQGLGAAGIVLVSRALVSRVGPLELRHFHGLYRATPRLAAAFFVLGMALVGFPGTATFVAGDLLIEGVLSVQPAAGVVLLLVSALNGITVLRLGARVFLGEPGLSRASLSYIPDLRPPEAAMAILLAGVLIVVGLVPGPLVSSLAGSANKPAVTQAP